MRAFFYYATLAVAGCGGIAVIDPEPDDGDGGGPTTTTAATTTTTGAGTGGAGAFDIAIVEAIGSADCMPEVPPDPLSYQFVLLVDNTKNTQSLQVDVTGATLQGASGTTGFEVDSSQPGLVAPGATAELSFFKLPATAMGSSGCAFCSATDTLLVLDVVAGGMPVVVSSFAGSISCAF